MLENIEDCLEYLNMWRHKRAQEVQITWQDLAGMPSRQLAAFETLDWVYDKIREELRKEEKTAPGE